MFVDGVIEDSATGWSSINSTMSAGIIGRSNYADAVLSDNAYTGYLKNIRILKGTALYTSTFTPPSTVSAIANTVLLVNGSTITDSSNLALSFTAITVLPNVSTEIIGTTYNTGNLTYSIAPSLPTGLTFDTANGFITGNTAQTVIANSYTVSIGDEIGQSSSNTFVMSIAPAISMSTSDTELSVGIGSNFNSTPATATGGYGTITYSIDGLGGNTVPYGSTINSSNGRISGIVTAEPGRAANAYPLLSTIKVVATDDASQQVSSANIVITVRGPSVPTSITSRAVRSVIANTTYASINIGVVTGGLGNLSGYIVPVSLGESNAALHPLAFSNAVPGMTYTFNPASNTVFVSGTPTKAIGFQYNESNGFLGIIIEPSTTRNFYVQGFDGTRNSGKGFNSSFEFNVQASKFYANTTTAELTFNTGTLNTFTPITVSGGYGVNGKITFALSGNTLPTGLTFITSNGAITGSPTILANANTFTITANDDSFQTASNTFTLQVLAPTGTSVNVMSFNEAGSGFDEEDGFTWQGLLPNDSTELVLSSSTPFTVEFWMKADNIPSAFIINTDSVNTGGAYSNGVNFWYNNGESFFSINGSGSGSRISSGAVDIFDSQWHHVALVRDGSSGKMFIDGIQRASTTSWGGINSTLQYTFIGSYQLGGDVFFGKLSNFRVTKTALYTTDFTVPSLPLVPITNTVLLLNSDTTYDSSNNHLTVVALNVDPTYEIGNI